MIIQTNNKSLEHDKSNQSTNLSNMINQTDKNQPQNKDSITAVNIDRR